MNKNDKYTNILLNDTNKIYSKLNAINIYNIFDNLYFYRKDLILSSYITENPSWLSDDKPKMYNKDYIDNNVEQVFNTSINNKILNRLSGSYYNTYKRIYNKNITTDGYNIMLYDNHIKIINYRMKTYKRLSYVFNDNKYIDDETGFYGVKNEYNDIIKSLFIEISQIYKVKIDLDNFYHIHLVKTDDAYILCAHTLEYVINKNVIQRDKIFTHNILGYIDKNKIFFCKPDNKYNDMFNSYSYSIEYEKLGTHFMDINLCNEIIHIAPIIYNQE